MKKNEILNLVIDEIKRLGSAAAVARKLGVSPATISQIRKEENWGEISESMWLKIAKRLDFNNSEWAMVETLNSRTLTQFYNQAKNNQMWIAIAHPAGAGKTATARAYANANADKAVYFLQCQEWNRTAFLRALASSMGLYTNDFRTGNEMADEITSYLIQRRRQEPVLILDEADKLTPAAIRALIPIYNQLEDQVGVVIQGTDNLEVQFEAGLKYSKKGYDELYSRFGRRFVNLYGASFSDVESICTANGLKGKKIIKKLFNECRPQQINIDGQFYKMVTDLRKLKRVVQREKLLVLAKEAA